MLHVEKKVKLKWLILSLYCVLLISLGSMIFFFCYAFSYFLPGSREVVSADFSENERNKTGTLQPEILSEFAFGEISFSDHVPLGPGRLGF